MAGKELIFVDRGVLLNLLASGCAMDLLRNSEHRYATAVGLETEGHALWSGTDESTDPEFADEVVTASHLVREGLLQTYEIDQHLQEYVGMAVHLSDRQAQIAALAIVHGGALATDDKRTRYVLIEQFDLDISFLSTTSIFQQWYAAARANRERIVAAAQRASVRAQFRPREDDPLYIWWLQLLGVNKTT